MKQVTGSNTPPTADKVSIQLALDGHSFSAPALSRDFPGDGPVEVEVLSPRTMLVPEEYFDASRGAGLLAANGMPAAADECVVSSSPSQGVVAVAALPAEALRQVRQRLGSRARFTAPLLCGAPARTPAVRLCRRGGLLYVTVFDPSLRMAEVIPVADAAETDFFLTRLGQEFPPEKFILYLAGDAPKELRKQLKNRYKETICE